MGLMYFPIGIQTFPYEFVSYFIKNGYKTLIETGTYDGNNALNASRYFEKVFTIEASPEFYDQAKEKCNGVENVECLFGDSKVVLEKILKDERPEKAVFWLDAHYSGGVTFQNASPLAEELELINKYCKSCVVLVDDARFIESRYVDERYMGLPLFMHLLSDDMQKEVSKISDVYVAYPLTFSSYVDSYMEKFTRNEYEKFLSFNGSALQNALLNLGNDNLELFVLRLRCEKMKSSLRCLLSKVIGRLRWCRK